MDNRPFSRPVVATMTVGPRILCLHPTTECSEGSPPCYLRRDAYGVERSIEFFQDVVRDAQACDSIREVVLSINVDSEDSTSNRDALRKISSVVRDTGMRMGVTTDYENVRKWGAAEFAACQSVTFTVDEHRFPSLRLPTEVLEQITQLQSEGCRVNLNLLLSKAMLESLMVPRLKRWLGIADQIYLLIPKHVRLDFTRADMLAFFDRISPIWESAEKFFHLHVDSCIKPEMFPWNLLTTGCEEAANLVNVLPDGGLAQCALDDPFVRLASADEFSAAVSKFYIDEPDSARPTCPEIEFLPNP